MAQSKRAKVANYLCRLNFRSPLGSANDYKSIARLIRAKQCTSPTFLQIDELELPVAQICNGERADSFSNQPLLRVRTRVPPTGFVTEDRPGAGSYGVGCQRRGFAQKCHAP